MSVFTLPRGTSSLAQFSLPSDSKLTADELDQLWALKPAERGTVKLYGKTFTVPRTQWNLGRDYRFSGVTHKAAAPLAVHPAIERLREFVGGHSGVTGWNQALVNFYDNGADHIGPHSDDESQLQKGDPIYSFSFGAERKFVIHNNDGGPAVLTVPLLDNTCTVMLGEMQSYYKHSVPPSKKVTERRLNVTFRLYKEY